MFRFMWLKKWLSVFSRFGISKMRDVVVEKDRKPAILVDIDGTAAIMGDRGAFEWNKVGMDTAG